MAIIWTAFFMSGLLCIVSQNIYFNENDDCYGEEKNTGTISVLLGEQRRKTNQLQNTVDELRKENLEIRALLTKFILTGLKPKRDCTDIYIKGYTPSSVYTINPFGNESQKDVYCDMVTEGGGWTAIQKRTSGSVAFNRTWVEYKKGFGDPNDSYWIGNDVIHQLTKDKNSSLYVSITLLNGTTLYEHYHQFSITDETDKYRLFLYGPATGTLGDSMLNFGYNYLFGKYFSTQDRDNDPHSVHHCADSIGTKGGWWFNWCSNAFLNGQWSPGPWYRPWYPSVTNGRDIKETLMMIKPH